MKRLVSTLRLSCDQVMGNSRFLPPRRSLPRTWSSTKPVGHLQRSDLSPRFSSPDLETGCMSTSELVVVVEPISVFSHAYMSAFYSLLDPSSQSSLFPIDFVSIHSVYQERLEFCVFFGKCPIWVLRVYVPSRFLLTKDLVLTQVVLLLLALGVVAVHGGGWGEGHCQRQVGVSFPRPHSVSILEFGAVGDGETLNTVAFQNAIFYLKSFADKGGAQLYVPRGRWLTGSFNITSHLTLFLDKGAVLIATQDSLQWPIVDPLPSYGQGMDVPGSRHRSMINGYNLTDVVITGDNGTIDGQGSVWWEWLRSHSLKYSRPHIVELVNCDSVIISNLTFLNSPAWSIHPVYSSNISIQNVTILDPVDSLTSGIVPDSCASVCIEDCIIRVSHDAIALKSGWDRYGISYAKPVSDVYISRIEFQSTLGSALAFGSEMSGGISNIHASDLHIYDSLTALKFKTARGRGGFIKNVVISDVEMENVHTAIEFCGHCGQHPDDHFDPDAFPIIDRITLKDMTGEGISVTGNLSGIEHDPFTTICLSNLNFFGTADPSSSWSCSNVWGFSRSVYPQPCIELSTPYSNSSSLCYSFEEFNGIQTA